MDPQGTVDLLGETWAATIALGRELDEPSWALPTDCPGWTVKDQVSHLIGTERLLQGLPSSDAELGRHEHVRNPIGELNEREVELRRGRAGAAVLAEFEELVDLRLRTLRSADGTYFEQAAMTPTGPGTTLDFLDIRVMDCWVHEQDIRRAIGRPGHLDGGPAEHSTDRLLRGLPLVVGKRAAAPEGSTTVLDLIGPVVRHVPVVVAGGRAKMVPPADAGEATATIAMDSETFLVLVVGRRQATDVAERVTITGDAVLGQAVVDNLNTMI